ncbi:MAG: glycosyltransferase, partial [Candidatus Ryanbacteria bacterium]|nr:glycosyltransferase [Candidatus Ryanbacteria bacterium]
MGTMKTLVIIPTWNERENISILIPAIFKILPDIDVLVVDDNSPDGTAEVVRNMQIDTKNLHLIVGHGKEGLGKAYIRGFLEVLKNMQFDQIIMMDADFSHDPQYLPDMIHAAQYA